MTMQTEIGPSQALQAVPGTMAAPVYYILHGTEQTVLPAPGQDRWVAVADAVGSKLSRQAVADDVPVYDAGTRCWNLTLTLPRRHGRADVTSVVVRW